MTINRRGILITGANGRVGRVLTRAWRETYELTLIDIQSSRRLYGTHVITADVHDTAAMRALCVNNDTVVHLAISANLGHTDESIYWADICGALDVLNAALAANCRRVVFASSLAIEIHPKQLYSLTKLETEKYARQLAESTGLSIHCLRLGRVLPPNDRAIWPTTKGCDRVLTHGDLVRLFTCSIEAPTNVHFGVFNGTSRHAPSFYDISSSRIELGYEPNDDVSELARRNYSTPIGLLRRAKSRLRRAWT